MSYLLGDYVTKEGLTHIKNHVYRSNGYSSIEYKLEPFWNWCVDKLPKVSQLTLDPCSQRGNYNRKCSCTDSICNHDVLWLILHSSCSNMDSGAGHPWHLYLPDTRRNRRKAGEMNRLVFSSWSTHGSRMWLPLLLYNSVPHRLNWTTRKWSLHLYTTLHVHGGFLLMYVTGVQYPPLMNSYRPLWCSWRLNWSDDFAHNY